jgi:hypothetical protein
LEHWLAPIRTALHAVAHVEVVHDFKSARNLLVDACPTLLATNLRLGAYNGIHLALMAALNQTRCVVYERGLDVMLARQAQLAGAFYARSTHLASVIRSLVTASLPEKDRRDPAVLDRRASQRTGRRSIDNLSAQAVTLPGLRRS